MGKKFAETEESLLTICLRVCINWIFK